MRGGRAQKWARIFMTDQQLYDELVQKIDCDWEVVQEFDGSVWIKFYIEENEDAEDDAH